MPIISSLVCSVAKPVVFTLTHPLVTEIDNTAMDLTYERSLFPLLIRVREEVDETIHELHALFRECKIAYPIHTGNLRSIHLGARNGCADALFALTRVATMCDLRLRAEWLETARHELVDRYRARTEEHCQKEVLAWVDATWRAHDRHLQPMCNVPELSASQYGFLTDVRLWSGATPQRPTDDWFLAYAMSNRGGTCETRLLFEGHFRLHRCRTVDRTRTHRRCVGQAVSLEISRPVPSLAHNDGLAPSVHS
jgi:hypothetical protein